MAICWFGPFAASARGARALSAGLGGLLWVLLTWQVQLSHTGSWPTGVILCSLRGVHTKSDPVKLAESVLAALAVTPTRELAACMQLVSHTG